MTIADVPGLPTELSKIDDDTALGLELEPEGLLFGDAAAAAVESGAAHPLCGGPPVYPAAFTLCRVYLTDDSGPRMAVAAPSALLDWAGRSGPNRSWRVSGLLNVLSAPRPPFAGLALDRPAIVGIVNATPDSFSDGGLHADPAAAIAHGHALVEAGAAMLDIGGESTRPGADTVPVDEEIARVLPVIKGLSDCGAPLSIDTRRGAVMRAALGAGATVVNDISALTDDPDAIDIVRDAGAHAILMHRGPPDTSAAGVDGDSGDALAVYRALRERVEACVAAGIPREMLAVDPGLGFGKTRDQNVALLARIGLLHGLGCAIMVGASRKFGLAPAPKDRLGASVASAVWAATRGARLIRVHDVAETREALALLARMAIAS